MKEMKLAAKQLLKEHWGIPIAYFISFLIAFIIVLPDLIVRLLIHISAKEFELPRLKLLLLVLDVPTWIVLPMVLIFILAGIYIRIIRFIHRAEMKTYLNIKFLIKFVVIVVLAVILFMFYQFMTILIFFIDKILKNGALAIYNQEMPIEWKVVCFIALSLFGILFAILYFKRFGALLILLFLYPNLRIKELFAHNKIFAKEQTKSSGELLKLFIGNFLFCILILPIFYVVPYFQIAFTLYVKEREDYKIKNLTNE